MLEIERGSTRHDSVWNSLWKGLLTCRKTGYRIKARRLKLKEKISSLGTSHVWVKKEQRL
jgi:hypothetical protein